MAYTDENRGIDPRLIKIEKAAAIAAPAAVKPEFKSAALDWLQRGLAVIPILPSAKTPAVKWDPWLAELSEDSIDKHWTQNPDHEVGFIVGDAMIVFDADTPQSIVALAQIEEAFDATPLWVHKTRRGEHHFFRRAPGTFAKSDAHSSTEHPERIDVKSGRSIVVLPPSTGKSVDMREVEHASELSEASQNLIDAVFRHNGRPEPRPAPECTSRPAGVEQQSAQQRDFELLIELLDPDCGYEEWRTILMAAHHTYGGDERGLEVVDNWSAKGKDYPGSAELSAKWKSFSGHSGATVTIASACKIAKDQGVDLGRIKGSSWETFQVVSTETVGQRESAISPSDQPRPIEADEKPVPIFSRYSLTGCSEELAKEVQAETFVLFPLALRGQATACYSSPNGGKTAVAISSTIGGIKAGLVDPQHVYYVNADDTSNGLLLKLKLAEKYGFHMLAPGHRNFDPTKLQAMLLQVCNDGTARETIVILDTVKKFTDLMDKSKVSGFTRVVREFVSHGGTLIGLAHVNKKKGQDGRSIHAGTTDIKDDFDCVYIIDVIDNGRESGTRIIEFNNEKRRGSVADTVRFSYRVGNGVSYEEMLESVAIVEATEADSGIPVTAVDLDAEAISVVEHSIRSGQCKKADLVKALGKHAGLSKRAAAALLERYTGHVSTLSRWNYEVRDHGSHCYSLLIEPAVMPGEGASDSEAADIVF